MLGKTSPYLRWTLFAAPVGFLVLILVIGVLTPARSGDAVRTDRLGPFSGESSEEYATRAAATVAAAGPEIHWGLVTFEPPVSSREVIDAVGANRISRVVVDGGAGARSDDDAYRVLPDLPIDLPAPVPGVNTPLEALESGVGAALSRIRMFRGVFDDGMTPQCDCIVGVVVRTDGDALRDVAESGHASAVEALAGDAVWGHFAVRAR